jgi:hypothetical protein
MHIGRESKFEVKYSFGVKGSISLALKWPSIILTLFSAENSQAFLLDACVRNVMENVLCVTPT